MNKGSFLNQPYAILFPGVHAPFCGAALGVTGSVIHSLGPPAIQN